MYIYGYHLCIKQHSYFVSTIKQQVHLEWNKILIKYPSNIKILYFCLFFSV